MSKKELCLSDQKYYCVVLLFSHWFVSSSLRLQGLQHARLPCPSLSLPVCSNSCPFSRWCCLTISFFVSLFSFCLQSFPVSVFSNESDFCIRWPKYWSFIISPSNEYWGLISFRIDWFDLLAVQGTLKSLLEHHSSKASILGRSAFFMVQLSHPYMTTGKTMALNRWTFVCKVMSLLFNMLSRFVISFFPRNKHLLLSRLQSPSTVILEPKKVRSVTVSIFLPSFCHEVIGLDATMIFLSFWTLSFKHQEALQFLFRCLPLGWYYLRIIYYYLHIWGSWYFSQQS